MTNTGCGGGGLERPQVPPDPRLRAAVEVPGMKHGNYCLVNWPEFGVFINGPTVKGFAEPGPVFQNSGSVFGAATLQVVSVSR